ncbi:MAG: hypothetical protein ACRDKE_01315 [Solirubrobacterales bacterium]
MNKALAFIPVFIVGALLMFLFDNTWTLLGGMIIQVIAVCMGVAAIAAPAFLEADADDSVDDEN